jgi:hypothetical protein
LQGAESGLAIEVSARLGNAAIRAMSDVIPAPPLPVLRFSEKSRVQEQGLNRTIDKADPQIHSVTPES